MSCWEDCELVFIWSDEIIDHIAQHGVTPEEFEFVVCFPVDAGESDSSGRPLVKGDTHTGRWIVCVYEMIDAITVLPVTAFETDRG